MGSRVQSVEVSYFLQMTEDEEKVGRAVAELLGGDTQGEREEVEGHFGNKIVMVTYHVTGDAAEDVLHRVVARMDIDERRAILGDIGSVVDEHNALFIRLSKQVLVMSGRAVLASADPVRIKVKPRPRAVGRDVEAFYSGLLEVGER